MSAPRTQLEALMERARSRDAGPRRPPPAEPERALIEHLETHAEHEAEVLRTYRELTATSSDDYVRYLARVILDDELHHHELLTEMLDRVRSDANCLHTEPSIPFVRTSTDSEALRAATTLLMRAEREDLRMVRALKRRLRPQRKTSLLWIMAEVLELDTRKHLRLLAFLRRTATL